MSYRISNVSRHMARFMRTQSSPPSSTRGGGGFGGNVSRNNINSSSSSSNSRSSSRQEQIFCNNNNNNNGTGIVSRPTNNNAGVGSLRSFASSASRTGEIAFADVVAAQRQNRKSARALVAFALEGLKMEAATMATNVNMVDLDEIILSTDSIGLFEEIEDTWHGLYINTYIMILTLYYILMCAKVATPSLVGGVLNLFRGLVTEVVVKSCLRQITWISSYQKRSTEEKEFLLLLLLLDRPYNYRRRRRLW